MGTANRDASQVTVKNRGKAVNAYYNDWKSATVNNNGGGNKAISMFAAAGAEVIQQQRAGCEACNAVTNELNGSPDANVSVYPPNRSSGGPQGQS
jgi:hypothetical protein